MHGSGKVVSLPMLDTRRQTGGVSQLRRPALSAQPVRRATNPGPAAERLVASARIRRGGSWGAEGAAGSAVLGNAKAEHPSQAAVAEPKRGLMPSGWEARSSSLCSLTQRVNSALGSVGALLSSCDESAAVRRSDATGPLSFPASPEPSADMRESSGSAAGHRQTTAAASRRPDGSQKKKRRAKGKNSSSSNLIPQESSAARSPSVQERGACGAEDQAVVRRQLCRTGSSYQQARQGHSEGQAQRSLFDMDMEMISAQLRELKQLPYRTPEGSPADLLLRDWKASRNAPPPHGVCPCQPAVPCAPSYGRRHSPVAAPPAVGQAGQEEGQCGGVSVCPVSLPSAALVVLAGCIVAPYAADAVYDRRVTLCEQQAVQELIRVMRTKLYVEQLVQVAVSALVAGLDRFECAAVRAARARVPIVVAGTAASCVAAALLAASLPCVEAPGAHLLQGAVERPADSPSSAVQKDAVVTEAVSVTVHPPVQHRRAPAHGAPRKATRRVSRTEEDNTRRSSRRSASGSVPSADPPAVTRSKTRDPVDRRRVRQAKRAMRLEQWESAIQGMDIGTLKLYVASLNGHFGPEHYSALLRLSMEDSVAKPHASDQELVMLKHRLATADDLGASCTICLDTYDEGVDVAAFPKCDHLFHSSCVTDYLKTYSRSCPLCKVSLRDASTEYDG